MIWFLSLSITMIKTMKATGGTCLAKQTVCRAKLKIQSKKQANHFCAWNAVKNNKLLDRVAKMKHR